MEDLLLNQSSINQTIKKKDMRCLECRYSNVDFFKLKKGYSHKQSWILQCRRIASDDSGVSGIVTFRRLKSVSTLHAFWRSSTDPVKKDSRVFEKASSPNDNLFTVGSSISDYNHETNS